MPNRILRDYTDSAKFEHLTAAAERLFCRLVTKADDFGRFHADPRLVRSACFPRSELAAESVGAWLAELDAAGIIHRYTAQGKDCLVILNFGQRNRATASKFPADVGDPPTNDRAPRADDRDPPTNDRAPRLARARSEAEAEAEAEAIRARARDQVVKPEDAAVMLDLGSNWSRQLHEWSPTDFHLFKENRHLFTPDTLAALAKFIPKQEPRFRGTLSGFLRDPEKWLDRARAHYPKRKPDQVRTVQVAPADEPLTDEERAKCHADLAKLRGQTAAKNGSTPHKS